MDETMDEDAADPSLESISRDGPPGNRFQVHLARLFKLSEFSEIFLNVK